mmetsp:Transcript_145331/g.267107  ORF Transcript_145331/g.267107 Transcript_145331/m.267107 type:complete len:617 (+) Transcript_145331:41-1891(+)
MSVPTSAPFYGATPSQEAVVTEKFMADSMDPSALSLDVGTAVTVISVQGQWATVKTAFGKTGVMPAACLKAQGQGLPGSSSAGQALLVLRGSRPPPAGTFFRADDEVGKMTRTEQFAPFACEFVGTLILTFTVGLCSIQDFAPYAPVASGLTYMVLIYALGPVSGANLNPAVTLTLWFLGKHTWRVVFGYLLSQFCAALLAGVIIFATFSSGVVVGPMSPYGWATAGLCEIFFTAMLCFVFAACAPSASNIQKEGKQFYALAIGFVFIAGGCACGLISTMMLNPAVAIGLDIVSFRDGIWNGFILGLFEVIGVILAVLLVKAVGKNPKVEGMFGLFPLEPTLQNRCVAEFFGTFAVVFVFGLNVVTTSYSTALSVAAALISMTYALYDVSGAHFNPAVTLAIWLGGRQKCEPSTCLMQVAMQVFGGIIAGFVLTFVHESGADATMFGLAPKGDFVWSQVAITEVFFTFLLTWALLCVSTVTQACPTGHSLSLPPRQNVYFALAIGSSVLVAVIAGGAVSGGIVNPAVAMGLSVEMSTVVTENTLTTTALPTASPLSVWEKVYAWLAGYRYNDHTFVPKFVNFVWYSLFELAGATLGAIMFHATHPHEFYWKNTLPS